MYAFGLLSIGLGLSLLAPDMACNSWCIVEQRPSSAPKGLQTQCIYLNSWLPAKASRNNSPTVSLHFFPTILHCTMNRFFIGLNSGLVLVDLERDCITGGGRTEEERSVGTKNTQGLWILCLLSSSGVVWCIALLDQKQLREHGQTGVSAYRLLVVAINMV